ncbi:MAG: hypothetical protein HQ517_10275 [SAR324 cluster bacterium]|nr:hypothetical protein [SAR324 cluster bacterium]
MIQANISEVKNRLSYYLRLVRGGEQVEILDRNTPLARITHISQAKTGKNETPWIKEVERLGIVALPKKREFPAELLSGERLVSRKGKSRVGVLQALLEERGDGR